MLAVDVEHLEVQRGLAVSLIGPNGAGKSTFFNVVSGFDRPQAGRWTYDGLPLAGRSASFIARAGLVRTFQHTRTLSGLTVLENVLLAAPEQRGESFWRALWPAAWRRQEADIEARARQILKRFELDHVQDLKAGMLSGGQRKLLELARAIMTQPTLLLLDEPMAGVNPVLRGKLLEHIAELRASGMTIFLIEHDMDAVAKISDWVICMAEGRVIAEGGVDEVRHHPDVIDAYLGRRRKAVREESPRRTVKAPPAVVQSEANSRSAGRGLVADRFAFEAHNLVAGYLPGIDILKGCSVDARAGELVGVFGPNGAGKSTLLKAVFGLAEVRAGELRLDGRDITGIRPHELVSSGIGYVPQLDNVFAALSVEENLRMGLFLRPKQWVERRDAMVDRFPILASLMRKRAESLSGGERKVVAMARALMMDPNVLLLDEPSAGLSPARQDELFELVLGINRSGVTIVIVEQNARQCLEICDRGYVLDRGANAFSGTSAELLNDQKVVELYLGALAEGRQEGSSVQENAYNS